MLPLGLAQWVVMGLGVTQWVVMGLGVAQRVGMGCRARGMGRLRHHSGHGCPVHSSVTNLGGGGERASTRTGGSSGLLRCCGQGCGLARGADWAGLIPCRHGRLAVQWAWPHFGHTPKVGRAEGWAKQSCRTEPKGVAGAQAHQTPQANGPRPTLREGRGQGQRGTGRLEASRECRGGVTGSRGRSQEGK